jgi:AcrR family transcriptional regulator
MMAGTDEDGASQRSSLGRPRDPHADEVIVDAAAGVLAESGPSGFTVDAVAARAGVGKATIYRRWPSKLDLLLSVSQQAAFELPDPDTGSLRDDFVLHLTQLASKLRHTMAGRVLPAIVAEAAGNREMRDLVARLFEERRALALGMLHRGTARGELPADTDLDLLLDLLAGPVFVRVLFTQMPVDEATVERVVDTVLGGVTGDRDA